MSTKLPPRTAKEQGKLVAMVVGGILAGCAFGAVTGSLVAAFAGMGEASQVRWMIFLAIAGTLTAVSFMVINDNGERRTKISAKNRRPTGRMSPPVDTVEYYLWKQDQERNNPFFH
jgi:MFS family permease